MQVEALGDVIVSLQSLALQVDPPINQPQVLPLPSKTVLHCAKLLNAN